MFELLQAPSWIDTLDTLAIQSLALSSHLKAWQVLQLKLFHLLRMQATDLLRRAWSYVAKVILDTWTVEWWLVDKKALTWGDRF